YYGQQAFFSIFNDITDRKNAENSLQESEILYKTIIDSTTDLICSVDVPGFRMLTYNQELYDYHKMRKVHLEKGMTPADIFDPVNAGIWTGLYQKTMIEDHVYLLNYKSTTGDYIYNFSLHLLKHNSEPFAISVFGNNITENKKAEIALKESEERFRVTFEKAGIGIALVDMDGKTIRNNSKLQEMLGYSEEELSLMPFPLFTHPDDIDKDWEQYTELKKGKTDTYQIEKRYIRKDGGVVWGNLTVSLVRSPDGMPLHAIGMVEDITHKKQLDRQILNSVI